MKKCVQVLAISIMVKLHKKETNQTMVSFFHTKMIKGECYMNNNVTESKNTINVLLFTSFGNGFLPSCIRPAINENPKGPLRERTGKVIEKIEETAYVIETLDEVDEKTLIKMIKKYNIVYCEKTNCYFYIQEDSCYDNIQTMKVEAVDTTCAWTILEYDGSEAIRYLKIIDSNINYYTMN